MTSIAEFYPETTFSYGWSVFAPYTYFSKVTLNQNESIADWWLTTFNGGNSANEARFVIGSVRLSDQSLLNKVGSVALLEEGSFYWDNENQILYVKYAVNNVDLNIGIGVLVGFSDSTVSYISDQEYLPYIQSIPSLPVSIDPLTIGKMQFLSGDIVLDNRSGYFDNLVDKSWFGVVAKIGFLNTDNTITYIAETIIEDEDLSNISYSVSLQDKRKFENVKVPTTRFVSADFDSSGNKNVGKLIPEGYGLALGMKCIEVKKVHATNRRFKFATDGTSITTVYAKEDDTWSSVTPTASYASTGEFELTPSDCTNASGDLLEIKADVVLRDETNPADIIANMNNRYAGVDFIASNYATWEKDYLSDISIILDKEKDLFEYIETIQTGSNINFFYFIDSDGKRNIKIDNPNRNAVKSLKFIDILNNEITANRDNTQFASKMEVKYGADSADNIQSRYLNDDFENEVFTRYHIKRELTGEDAVNSLLTTESDAIDKSNILMDDYRLVKDIFENEFKLDENYDLEVLDIINIDFTNKGQVDSVIENDLLQSDYDETVVTQSDYKASSILKATHEGQTITYINQRSFYGEQTLKIIGLDPNIADNILTVTARVNEFSEEFEEVTT